MRVSARARARVRGISRDLLAPVGLEYKVSFFGGGGGEGASRRATIKFLEVRDEGGEKRGRFIGF